MSWNILGQDLTVSALRNSVQDGKFGHAYLIVGPPLSGRSTLAYLMAQAANCLEEEPPCGQCNQCQRIQRGFHTDIQIVVPEINERTGRTNTEITIDQIRELEKSAILGAYEGTSRVFIIDGAELLSEEGANALLKTLEEPPPKVLFVLITSNENRVLPTILSRCQRLEMSLLDTDIITHTLEVEQSLGENDARLLAKLSGGRLGWALKASKDPRILEQRQQSLEELLDLLKDGLEGRFQRSQDMAGIFARDRESVRAMLHLWLDWWRDLLMLKEKAGELVRNEDWLDSLLERESIYSSQDARYTVREILATIRALEQNANARIALDVLMIELPRQHSY